MSDPTLGGHVIESRPHPEPFRFIERRISHTEGCTRTHGGRGACLCGAWWALDLLHDLEMERENLLRLLRGWYSMQVGGGPRGDDPIQAETERALGISREEGMTNA